MINSSLHKRLPYHIVTYAFFTALTRRLHGAVLHTGRDGTAPQRRTGTEGRFVGRRCEYADFPQLHATLPEVEPRHPPRSAPDGADPATHLRRHPSRDLLLHQSDRLDSLRSLPKRAFRPHHRHPAPIRIAYLPAPGGHGLPEKSDRKSVMRPCRGNNNPVIIWYSGFISVPL